MTFRRGAETCLLLWLAAIALAGSAPRTLDDYPWQLPPGWPTPRVPADNPMTTEKAELGRFLFYEARLSGNGRESCATCHDQTSAFTDGRAHAVGITGEEHPRSSMSLVNVAYAASLTWANPTLTRLEDQALVPIFGEHPVEMGSAAPGTKVLDDLRARPAYQRLFAAAFPGETDPISTANIGRALACFERTIISARSPYDRYHDERDETAISESAKRGEKLFFSQPLSCFRCHGGFTFSGAVDYEGKRPSPVEFHNTGLYNLPGLLSYPPPNTGLYESTGRPEDVGKFRAPTLRNIAITAPYMHDGSIATLEDVIAHYAAGGRAHNPNRSPLIKGFAIDAGGTQDLVAFLDSLTDQAVLLDRRWSKQGPVR